MRKNELKRELKTCKKANQRWVAYDKENLSLLAEIKIEAEKIIAERDALRTRLTTAERQLANLLASYHSAAEKNRKLHTEVSLWKAAFDREHGVVVIAKKPRRFPER